MSLGSVFGAVAGGIIGFFIGGPKGAFLGASIGFSLGAMVDPITPDIKSPGTPVDESHVTSNEIGNPIYDALGTVKIRGQLLFYGKERAVAQYQETGGGKGGGGGEDVLTGYKYYASWGLGICLGPVDCLYTIFKDEKIVWEGETNRPLAGGSEEIIIEGLGAMRLYFGTHDQTANANVGELTGYATLNSPMRGLCWAFFGDCYMGEFNRLPTMAFVLRRTPVLAFSTKNIIRTLDYNPAHAMWYILHHLTGLPETWLHTADFSMLADKLAASAEKRGISILFDQQQAAMTYLESINDHIDSILRFGSDGTFHPKLIREDYVVGDLELIDESVVVDKPTFTRKSWIDTINEVKVQYSELPHPPPIIPDFIYTAEISGTAAADIVKRSFSDLSESIRTSMGNTPAGGIPFNADVKYLVGSSVPPTWNVTIPAVTLNRIRAILELDPTGNALYVAIGVFDGSDSGDGWILHKRSLADGSAVWQYLHSTFFYSGAHEITGLSYCDGNIYIIGLTDGGTSKRSWAVEKRTSNNAAVWLKLAGTPAPVYDSRGGAICADSSGVYCAIFSGIANNWVVQKRALSDGAIVWEKIVAYGTIVPHKIILFGDHVYVMGGTGSWIIEKRRKSDGVRLYYRSWAPSGGGSEAILNSFSINPDWPFNLQGYIRVCGYDMGGGGGAYRVRIERLLESDFSTNTFVATGTKQFGSGMDVDEGIGVYDSVICAVPTHNSGTGKKDVMIQRRKASDLTL